MEAAAPAFSYARANEPRNTRKTRKGLSGDRSFCINGGITVLRQDLRPADRLAPIKGSNIMAAVTLRKPANFPEMSFLLLPFDLPVGLPLLMFNIYSFNTASLLDK